MKKWLTILLTVLCVCKVQAEVADSVLFDAYLREDMSVWKKYMDTRSPLSTNFSPLLYEYGYCGYMVDRDKTHALPYVRHFKAQISNLRSQLPAGHYEMYMSAVLVYELQLHESVHPFKAMSLAKEATRLAPKDPLVLSYYATCLFYAPKPFGSKKEALMWFERAKACFKGDIYRYCWVREANEMYIRQCHDKLKKQ